MPTFLHSLFWLMLIAVAFFATVHISLNSLNRYETSSTVVTIERDHYYWNTSLPSFTICPVKSRIDEELFDQYCEQNHITGTAKDEFYEFIESLANASYESFDLIQHYNSVDRLNIQPENYMMLIYNLTKDQLRGDDPNIKAVLNADFIRCEQVLTENGICYVSNNFLAANLSAMYILTGMHPRPLKTMTFYQHFELIDVIAGNLFDGDKSYSMSGFPDDAIVS
ncbi:uncharacterized protein LOC129567903 [Sitodiplosis mosellana]|uniref:uncharacterized protein LOC129567903 n=1 Tax=Sitodiplosis mosellana TaxID=263140 RepID=UPI002443870C|nr:uncharacterized protein LOC129567903 [Sitodiplosis mosellana]